MGDILDFRLGSGCERQRPLAAGPAEIVAFTGAWHRARAGTNNQPLLMRCRRLARSLAPVWAIVSASLLDPKNRPNGAAAKSNSRTPAIPKPSKRSSISP